MQEAPKSRVRRRRAKRSLVRHVSNPGAPPGTLHIPEGSPAPKIEVMRYGPQLCERFETTDPDEIPDVEDGLVTWVNVEGLGDEDVLLKIGDYFDLHPLALEDAVSLHQRSKVEEYDDHVFLVLWMMNFKRRLEFEQVSLFVGRGYVVTLQEGTPGDSFEPVRERIQRGRGRIRKSGADYLTYALLDAVIDGYFPVLENFSDDMERTEREILDGRDGKSLGQILDLKHDLQIIRRAIWPLRETTNILTRDSIEVIEPETRVYLRDCHDHAIQAMELVESYRERASTLMEAHMSSVSFRMNQVMQVLTVISTLFIPLTFIVGVYGMNFDSGVSDWNMPELKWRYGYAMVWALMIAVAAVLLGLFHRIGWLSLPRRPHP